MHLIIKKKQCSQSPFFDDHSWNTNDPGYSKATSINIHEGHVNVE